MSSSAGLSNFQISFSNLMMGMVLQRICSSFRGNCNEAMDQPHMVYKYMPSKNIIQSGFEYHYATIMLHNTNKNRISLLAAAL